MGVQEKVAAIQLELEGMMSSRGGGGGGDQSGALDLLKTLRDLEMDLTILSSTRIGITVNQLRKGSADKEVISLAKLLIKKWIKDFLPEEEKEKAAGSSSSTTTITTSSTRTTTPKKSSSGKKGRKSKGDSSDGGESSSAAKMAKLEEKNEPRVADEDDHEPSDMIQRPPKAIVSIYRALGTQDPVRLKCREMLTSAIRGDGSSTLPDGTNDPELLADQLEDAIYKEFKHTEMKYKNRVRSRIANLKDARNPNLRLNFLIGEIRPERLAKMSAEEMASDELKSLRSKLDQEGIKEAQLATVQGTKTDLLKCGKCWKRDCTYNQLQTRSADEPMTTFVLCNNCGNRWKFN